MSEQRFIVPEVVATHFHLRPGDQVADFGAGSGHFEAVLSRLVGPEGKVLAIEIQKGLVEKLDDKVRRERLGNVTTLWGDIEEVGGTKIADAALDAAIMVNTLFQMESKNAAVSEIYRVLRGGGKFFLIDWSESWGGLGPQPGQVLNADEARSLAETAGFTFERNFDAGDHHYGLAFRK